MDLRHELVRKVCGRAQILKRAFHVVDKCVKVVLFDSEMRVRYG